MKKTDIEQLRQESLLGLKARLDGARRELFKLKINVATAHVKDYSQFKKNKRTIARILTFLRQKENF